MTTNKSSLILTVPLVLFALMSLYYGVIHLFFPEFEINSTGEEPIDPGWIRWFGAILIPLGIGALMILRNPKKQGIFVTTIAIGTLLLGLTLFYSLFFEDAEYVKFWKSAIPAIVNLVLSILLLIGLKKEKEILW